MSRSRKKNPIIGNSCAASDKRDKQAANRKLRRIAKELLVRDGDETSTDAFSIRAVSDVWLFAKDGKSYFKTEKSYRK